MGLFSRREREADLAAAEPEEPQPTRERGPWDGTEVDEIGRRVDLGAIWLPPRKGMELRMEVDKASQVVKAAGIKLGDTQIQVQAFAAPKSGGLWDEIRAEIAESITTQGGSSDDLPGPFGRELLARLPVRTENGRTGHRPARFIGFDGPRWFLRGVMSGKGAVDPAAAETLESVFADIVVVRGDVPRAPRDLLPLHLPGKAPAPGQPGQPAAPGGTNPLAPRGPEITEVR